MKFLDELLDRYKEDDEKRLNEEAARRGISVEALQKEESDREKEAQMRAVQERKERHQKEQARRRHYGKSMGLGVAAHNGNILVIGGLTERSSGSGMVRNTVWHVVLDEPYQKGRLIRRPGDLLCKSASKLGRRSMGIFGAASSGPDNGLDDISWRESLVTCKSCLEQLKRLTSDKENKESHDNGTNGQKHLGK